MKIKKKIVVHAGLFHADDVLCVAMMRILNADISVERVYKVPEHVDDDTIVADIGGGKYDHHQANAPIRRDGFPHCAASLMWEDGYGEQVVSKLHPRLVEEQVQSVARGVPQYVEAFLWGAEIIGRMHPVCFADRSYEIRESKRVQRLEQFGRYFDEQSVCDPLRNNRKRNPY